MYLYFKGSRRLGLKWVSLSPKFGLKCNPYFAVTVWSTAQGMGKRVEYWKPCGWIYIQLEREGPEHFPPIYSFCLWLIQVTPASRGELCAQSKRYCAGSKHGNRAGDSNLPVPRSFQGLQHFRMVENAKDSCSGILLYSEERESYAIFQEFQKLLIGDSNV